MPRYTFLSGETIEFSGPPADVAAHLARVEQAAADPTVGLPTVLNLVYGPDNPLLDRAAVPGRAIVTQAVLDAPAYQVMSDLIGVKRAQLGLLDPAAADAAYTVDVAAAAAKLGIGEAAVRAAIAAGKLAARKKNGQWYTRPEAVAAYQVSGRGRKKSPRGTEKGGEDRFIAAQDQATADDPGDPVRGVIGSEPGHSLVVKVQGGEFVREEKHASRTTGHLSPGWTRAVVRTTAKREGKPTSVRAFVLEPAEGANEEVVLGGLGLRGPFRIVEKVNNPKAAGEVWAGERCR